MTGINETLDVLKVLAVLADQLMAARADGRIDLMDVAKGVPVVAALKEAWTGSDHIDEELADLSREELVALVKVGVENGVKLVLAITA